MERYTLLLLLWLLSLSATYSQTSCSTVAAGPWESASTWSCGVVPSAAFSGTIVIQHNQVTLSSSPTLSNLVTVVVKNNGVFKVNGNNTLTLSNNSSKIDIQAGSSVTGQNANSIIVIGTSPSFTYTMNGSGNAVNGPITMSNTGTGALPVELLYFRAVAEGRRVSLSWATASEQNAARFVVERSANLGEFLPVGTLAAVGNSTARQHYGLLDAQPLVGVGYYRLRQDDHDGRSTYSRPVAVDVQEGQAGLLLLGNPIRAGVLRLSTEGLANASYSLSDLQGRAVPIGSQTETNGEVTLRLGNVPATGLYLLTVQHSTGRLVRKVMVE
jgi:hypothetical protein